MGNGEAEDHAQRVPRRVHRTMILHHADRVIGVRDGITGRQTTIDVQRRRLAATPRLGQLTFRALAIALHGVHRALQELERMLDRKVRGIVAQLTIRRSTRSRTTAAIVPRTIGYGPA
jgi:hypothetical protein